MSSAKKATLSYEDGKSIEFPVLSGSIGPDVVDIRPGVYFANPDKIDDRAAVRFQAKNIAAIHFRKLAEALLNQGVQLQRFQKKGLSLFDILQPVWAGLHSGAIHPTAEAHAIVADHMVKHVRKAVEKGEPVQASAQQ